MSFLVFALVTLLAFGGQSGSICRGRFFCLFCFFAASLLGRLGQAVKQMARGSKGDTMSGCLTQGCQDLGFVGLVSVF